MSYSKQNLESSDIVISYLNGTLKRILSDRVVIDVGGVGYDVFLPAFVMRSVELRPEGDPIEMDIYYHVSERQMKPMLIGFNNGHERRFFEKFITVEDIGPQKAAKALSLSVSTVARAIENEDFSVLRSLPGIGDRTAKKMVATLRGRVAEEALLQDEGYDAPQPAESAYESPSDLYDDAIEVLVSLGHRTPEAVTKVDAALKRLPQISTVDELILEVYRGEQGR